MENLSVFSHVASANGNLFVGVARPAHFVCGPSRCCAVGAVCARSKEELRKRSLLAAAACGRWPWT